MSWELVTRREQSELVTWPLGLSVSQYLRHTLHVAPASQCLQYKLDTPSGYAPTSQHLIPLHPK